MNRPVKFWELLMAAAGIVISMAVMIYNRGIIDTSGKDQIQFMQTQFNEFKAQQEATNALLFQKIDKMVDGQQVTNDRLGELKVLLQNKQDRK